MTPFDQFLQFLVKSWKIDVVILAKAGSLILLFVFFLFSLVVVRQVGLMNQTVSTELDKPLMWAGRVLIVLAIAAFILGLCIL